MAGGGRRGAANSLDAMRYRVWHCCSERWRDSFIAWTVAESHDLALPSDSQVQSKSRTSIETAINDQCMRFFHGGWFNPGVNLEITLLLSKLRG
jgi:hypothetical protein